MKNFNTKAFITQTRTETFQRPTNPCVRYLCYPNSKDKQKFSAHSFTGLKPVYLGDSAVPTRNNQTKRDTLNKEALSGNLKYVG